MTKPARRTLDPKLDVVFKLLFAHPASKSSLISLLTAVLQPAAEIVDVEVLNPDMPRQDAADKGIVLDLRVRLADGRLIDVEMQSQWRSGSRKRFLFYWAKGFITQLQRGDDYAKLEPVIVVVFTDYRELASERLHSTFRLLEVTHHEELCDDMEIHFVELPNLKKAYDQERAANRMLTGWSSFLAAKTDEEVEAAAMEDPMIDQAKEVLESLSEDPKVRELASWREAHLALDKMQREMERREALEEGREEGLKAGEKAGEKRGRDEGLKEGRKEGRDEGNLEGKKQILLRLIEQRFGAITPQRLARVEAGDIDRMTGRLFDAATFDELFEEA